MGRFETTAATYARYREPYPPAFFQSLAELLGLTGRERLIDLGTGPGVLALGFKPHVGSVLGVDPEAEMLAAARAAAGAAGVDLPLINARAEDLSPDHAGFDIVTIGRALHWMDRTATVPVLDRLLAPRGAILVTGCSPAKDARNPWNATFEAISHAWAPYDEASIHAAYRDWFADTPFGRAGAISIEFVRPVTPAALFARALTRSSSSAKVLGDRIDACRTELVQALSHYFPDGPRPETLVAKADIMRRR